ncbi:MAG TPA: CpaD family pilus assembly lipoprotein [Geminicoccaceae bacterium]
MSAVQQHFGYRLRQAPRPLVWLSLLGLGLGACAPNLGPQRNLGWIEGSSPKQLEVDRAEYRHSVYFPTDRSTIPASERARLLSFLETVRPAGRDSVRLEGHADERASELYNLELAADRNERVEALLREVGLGSVPVTTVAYGEAVPAVPSTGPAAWGLNRRVELILERHLVTLPACPDWSRKSGTDFSNQPHSNFGCATQTNLGLMVAEPKDLVSGRTLAPADGVHQAEGVVRYRTGKVVELEEERIQN